MRQINKYEVRQIKNLLDHDLEHLVKESKDEGFRFVERLLNDYKDGSNAFNLPGEGLFGVWNEDGVLVAIGGLNKDPFSDGLGIGRLRRFYVRKDYRRNGIGSLLVNSILDEARKHFKVMVLNTDTEKADKFYTALGFTKGHLYPKATHFMEL